MIYQELERSHYRSTGEVLDRYGVPLQKLERWRERGEPRFPTAIEVSGDLFFHFLHLVRWEIIFERLSRKRRRGGEGA